jgi:zinc D-Ala-D-Ala carboxypeptidase
MNKEDFNCKCGCGLGWDDMNKSTRDKLHEAESYCPFVFKINSGIRCKTHNENTPNASKSSSHPKGYAGDIGVRNSWERFIILSALIKAGFKRIGVAKTFIHADDDPDKPEDVLWTY